jgi:transposase
LICHGGTAAPRAAYASLAGSLGADGGYDTDRIRAWLADRGGHAAIPTRRCRKVQVPVDRALYARRHVVENFFCRLKDCCRVALRRDNTAASYMAWVQLAAALNNISIGA